VYLLDSSAIAIILRRLGKRAVNYLKDVYTLDLARYELGNVVWKEHTITSMSLDETINKAGYIAKLLKMMEIKGIQSDEDFKEIMRLALKLKLTFYDASYLHIARKDGLTLVTEDRELMEKSKESGIKAVAVNDYIKE